MSTRYRQIGVASLRTPSGDLKPAIPLYIKESDAGKINPDNGMTIAEELAVRDIAEVLAEKFDRYKKGVK